MMFKHWCFLYKAFSLLLQGGAILHAQLEIWKAAYSEEGMQWMPESASSNASSGDVSDGKFWEVVFEYFFLKPI